MTASNEELLRFYQQRALGPELPGRPAPKKPLLSVVHAQAEAIRGVDRLRKLDGQEPGDGGRKG